MRPYSIDLRKAALKLRKQGKTYKEITQYLGVSRNTVYLWSKRDTLEPSKSSGRPEREVGIEDWQSFTREHEGKTLKQMSELLSISKSTLHIRLRKAGLSYKKKSRTYLEANKDKQESFKKHVSQLDPSKVYYLDESGFEERHFSQSGWSAKGTRLPGKKKAKEEKGIQL